MNFNKTKILVIGDIMLDRYIQGNVNRISPEAPVPVLKYSKTITKLGGAANVAQNLRDLGCDVVLCSVIGDDETGKELATLLSEKGIDARLISQKDRPTTIKTRFLSGGHQILRLDAETTDTISLKSEELLWHEFVPVIKEVDAIVISDYDKGVLTDDILSMAINVATLSNNKPIVVDPKRKSFRAYAGATVITPNEKELFAAIAPHWRHTDNDLQHALRELGLGSSSVLLTRSERGMSLFKNKGFDEYFHAHVFDEPIHVAAHAKEVVDVCGAGDTVVSTLAACLAIGMTLEDAMIKANLAASIVVGKLGVASVSTAELDAAGPAEQAHTSLDDAKKMVLAWKEQGLKVGFTNGCYDLVHPGHVKMLEACANECDRLVVGLNSDASVQRLKGATRPIQSEEARAIVLAGLRSVDLIVIFDEDTPQELIEALTPDVLMKGADYTLNTVVGAKHVMANGGQVKLIPLQKGHSTSNLIRKMNEPDKKA